MKHRRYGLAVAWLSLVATALAQEPVALPGTAALNLEGDLSRHMVAGIDTFLNRALQQSVNARTQFWQRDFSSPVAYGQSIAPNREHLRKIIGAVDERLSVTELELVDTSAKPAVRLETDLFTATAVRWPVFQGVWGEGLWLKPKRVPLAWVVALPDADQTPEMLTGLAPGLEPERQWARRLAEIGCEVIVPALIDRQDTFSGNPVAGRVTNQPHREWIYRQAFELGRHVIGYETLMVSGALDFLERQAQAANQPGSKLGVAGYGEGALIAFYTAALDPRVASTLVSGYFDSRQQLWTEPIYRNVFGLLREFGDAEIATLILPRTLVVEHSQTPQIKGPPPARDRRSGAAPGTLKTPDCNSVQEELARVESLFGRGRSREIEPLKFIAGIEGMTTGPGSDRALIAFLNGLQVPMERLPVPGALPDTQPTPEARDQRQEKLVGQLEAHTQALLRKSELERTAFFWNKVARGSTTERSRAAASLRKVLAEEVLGSFGAPTVPMNARSRRILEKPAWNAYEIMLDVYPDVFAWGYLLVPNKIPTGERRPVVVCQHGLEGVPADVINEDPGSEGFRYYKAFANRLASEGFVVFAPHNPYRGGDRFRVLQRKANPLGKSLFSIIIAQHSRILEFLAAQPFVDANRIGFYGLSYGGKTAMRVPAVLENYALSICSADFNEWVHKNAATEFAGSYMYTGEYEMPEWNLGHTFNYAEMAALIAPRPFMVERGHQDGVGRDEWVAYEYAKVRRFYDELGLGDRTAIEFFNGPHTINGVGTFEFLRRHLK